MKYLLNKKNLLLVLIIVFVICVAFISQSLVSAEESQAEFEWTSIGPWGGTINDLAIDPNNSSVLYAGVDHGGIYKSTNNGASWQVINSGMESGNVYSIAIHPVDSSIIYIGTYDGIYKSVNGGNTWMALNYGISIPLNGWITSVVIDPKNPSTIYFGNYWHGVFKSSDDGVSWQEVNSGFGPSTMIRSLKINPDNTSIIYAGLYGTEDEGGLYKSTDKGANWQQINSNTVNDGKTVIIDPVNPDNIFFCSKEKIFKSPDGGSTWQNISPNQMNYWLSLYIDQKNPLALYTSSNEGMYKSMDGGVNWQLIGSETNLIPLDFIFDYNNPDIVYAGDRLSGVYKSMNGGIDWYPVNNGISNTKIRDFVFDPNNSNVIYAATYSGVFKSTDKGGNWKNIFPNIAEASLVIDPINSSNIYISTDRGVFKSTDGGAIWKLIFSESGIINNGITIDPKNPNIINLFVSGRLYRSYDYGLTWGEVSSEVIAETFVTFFVVDPIDSSILYAGSDKGILKSENGGLTWRLVNNGLDLEIDWLYDFAIDPVDNSVLFLVTSSGLYKSTNGADIWQKVDINLDLLYPNGEKALAMAPTDHNIIYLSAGTQLLRSANAGSDWEILINGEIWPSVLKVDYFDANVVYAGTSYKGVYKFVSGEYSKELSTIYENDFSEDPNWITDQPENYYWDESEQALFVRAYNRNPEYTPNRYFYIPTDLDTSKSFTITWDQKFKEFNGYSRINFGLYNDDFTIQNRTYIYMPRIYSKGTINGWLGYGNSYGFNAIGENGGFIAGGGGFGGYNIQTERWFQGIINYDADSATLEFKAEYKDDGEILYKAAAPVSRALAKEMVNLGVGGYPTGTNPQQIYTRYPESYTSALFDNIKLTGFLSETPIPDADVCGNRICSENETCETCEVDCGVCTSVRILEYSTETGYKDGNPMNESEGVHPDIVDAKIDEMTFKAVYTDSGNKAPKSIVAKVRHEKDFDNNYHMYEMVSDFDIREELVWKDIPEIYPNQSGRVIGYDSGLFSFTDKDGFDGDESLTMDLPGNNKQKVFFDVVLTDYGWGIGKPNATIKLEALDKNDLVIDEMEQLVIVDNEDEPKDSSLYVESEDSQIAKIRFSVSKTDECETWIKGIRVVEELIMEKDNEAIDTEMRDDDFINGEQYIATSTFTRGDYEYRFEAISEDNKIVLLPEDEYLSFSVSELFVYVALGDSYQSGEGVGNSFGDAEGFLNAYENGENYPAAIMGQENTYGEDFDGNTCHRSLLNYAKINRDKLNPGAKALLIDVTCSGATIEPGSSRVKYKTIIGEVGNESYNHESQIASAIEQLEYIGLGVEDVDLVTVGMGGNDAKFSKILMISLFPELFSRIVEKYPNSPDEIMILSKILTADFLDDNIFSTDEAIDSLSQKELWGHDLLLSVFDEARIMQLNYPNIIPQQSGIATGTWCGGMNKDSLGYANRKINRINTVLTEAISLTADNNPRYELVDVYDSFGSNAICPLGDGAVYANSINEKYLDKEIKRILNHEILRPLIDDMVSEWNENVECYRRASEWENNNCNEVSSATCDSLRDCNTILSTLEFFDSAIPVALQLYLRLDNEILPNIISPAEFGEDDKIRLDRAKGLFHPNKLGFEQLACKINDKYNNSNNSSCQPEPVEVFIDKINDIPVKNYPFNSSPDEDVKVEISGFMPNSEIQVMFFSKAIKLGTFLSNDKGMLIDSIKLPNVGPGVHALILRGNTIGGVSVQKQILINYPGRPSGDDGTYGVYLCGFEKSDFLAEPEKVDIYYYSNKYYTVTPNEDGCIHVEVPLFDFLLNSKEFIIEAVSQESGRSLSEVIESIPSVVGLWSLDSLSNSLTISGSKNSVIGKMHSEYDIIIKGSNNVFAERPEYVSEIIIKGNNHEIPEGRQVKSDGLPKTWKIEDYRPGGSLAVDAGDDYHEISEDMCVNGLWRVEASKIPDGIVYVPCSLEIYGNKGLIKSIVVSEGDIVISGSSIGLGQDQPNIPAIISQGSFRISGSNNKLLGTVQALNGDVRISGAKGLYRCGVIAQTIEVSGSNNNFIVDEECRARY